MTKLFFFILTLTLMNCESDESDDFSSDSGNSNLNGATQISTPQEESINFLFENDSDTEFLGIAASNDLSLVFYETEGEEICSGLITTPGGDEDDTEIVCFTDNILEIVLVYSDGTNAMATIENNEVRFDNLGAFANTQFAINQASRQKKIEGSQNSESAIKNGLAAFHDALQNGLDSLITTKGPATKIGVELLQDELKKTEVGSGHNRFVYDAPVYNPFSSITTSAKSLVKSFKNAIGLGTSVNDDLASDSLIIEENDSIYSNGRENFSNHDLYIQRSNGSEQAIDDAKPFAHFSSDVDSSYAPAEISILGGGSRSAIGSVLEYYWEVRKPPLNSLLTYGNNPNLYISAYTPGTYSIYMRVTDTENNLSSQRWASYYIYEQPVEVTPPASCSDCNPSAPGEVDSSHPFDGTWTIQVPALSCIAGNFPAQSGTFTVSNSQFTIAPGESWSSGTISSNGSANFPNIEPLTGLYMSGSFSSSGTASGTIPRRCRLNQDDSTIEIYNLNWTGSRQ